MFSNSIGAGRKEKYGKTAAMETIAVFASSEHVDSRKVF